MRSRAKGAPKHPKNNPNRSKRRTEIPSQAQCQPPVLFPISGILKKHLFFSNLLRSRYALLCGNSSAKGPFGINVARHSTCDGIPIAGQYLT